MLCFALKEVKSAIGTYCGRLGLLVMVPTDIDDLFDDDRRKSSSVVRVSESTDKESVFQNV